MTPLDKVAPALAWAILGRLGKRMELVTTTPGEFDPATGTTGPATEVVAETFGAIDHYSAHLVDGENIRATDKRVFVLSSPEPSTDAALRFDGRSYQIIRAEPQYSGERVALWEVQAR